MRPRTCCRLIPRPDGRSGLTEVAPPLRLKSHAAYHGAQAPRDNSTGMHQDRESVAQAKAVDPMRHDETAVSPSAASPSAASPGSENAHLSAMIDIIGSARGHN